MLILIAATINIKTGSVDLSYVLSVVFLTIYLSQIILVAIYLRVYKNSLDEERHKNRCGYFYIRMNYKQKSSWVLAYPLVYQLRFVILTIVTLFLENFALQVLVMCMVTVFICAILGLKHPYSNTKMNYVNLAGEMVILSITDMLLVCTDPSLEV